MGIHYPRLSQLLTLGLHSRMMQSGPPILRTSLESTYASPFIVKKFRRLSTSAELIHKFSEACILPLILYCSPAIFPELLKHDFALFNCSIKLISQVSGLSFSYLTNLPCERHINASSDFAARILGDH